MRSREKGAVGGDFWWGLVWELEPEFLKEEFLVSLGLGRHLEFLLREYEDYYNTVRPHQGLGNVPLNVIPLPACGPPDPAKIECEARLGGLLRHYHRAAA